MDFGQNLFNLLGKMDICNDFVKAKKQIHPYSEWICLVPGYVVEVIAKTSNSLRTFVNEWSEFFKYNPPNLQKV